MATNGQNNQTNDPLTLLFQSSFVEPEQNGHHQPTHEEQIEAYMAETRYLQRRSIVWGALTVLFVAALAVVFGLEGTLGNWSWSGKLPKNADAAAQRVLTISPIIDGHIDLPILVRETYANNATAVDLESAMPRHVDIPRLRTGKVGGFFWSVYVDCANPDEEGDDFVGPTWRVRDTLEQIDVATGLIEKYPDTFYATRTSQDIYDGITQGKIASLLGVEGAHQLGNSIAVLRQYYALGVRYVTLTHTCHNAFADSCGLAEGTVPLHGGLSKLGYKLIDEMNRIGMLVDLSHTSDATAEQALLHSQAPVIWSHSSARAVHNAPRNVPDSVLRLIGTGEGQNDAVVMVNFAPQFIAPDGQANVQAVADHVEHIASIAGRRHVGIGSDFDGISTVPRGLEDVSKYPALIAELFRRGWNKFDLSGLAGANFLRVYEEAERVSARLKEQKQQPAYDLYEKRPDLPM